MFIKRLISYLSCLKVTFLDNHNVQAIHFSHFELGRGTNDGGKVVWWNGWRINLVASILIMCTRFVLCIGTKWVCVCDIPSIHTRTVRSAMIIKAKQDVAEIFRQFMERTFGWIRINGIWIYGTIAIYSILNRSGYRVRSILDYNRRKRSESQWVGNVDLSLEYWLFWHRKWKRKKRLCLWAWVRAKGDWKRRKGGSSCLSSNKNSNGINVR